ncbi:hypothetical protein CKAH01_15703 [Colletotrichum kahawae]|uniref:Uncharacterized protein n=1 Tax=Colletotrichum kahawae TaxID=34407 RepID=A0AAD9YI84_COLKA|nr:hypothetical protein CKAH01_15703 [Colletotrichum kahawae]
MGAQTDSGHWNNAYHVLYPLSIGNQQYFFGHNLETNYWFIQELLPGGKMGSETDQGHWATRYAAQFPFTIGGTQYIYGQDVGNPYVGGSSSTDEGSSQGGILGDIGTGAKVVGDVLGKSLIPWSSWLIAADLSKLAYAPQPIRRWFIQKVLPGGKLGDETDSGHWIGTYQMQFPYVIDGKQYFYGQDLGTKKWIIQRLNDGGKMGSELQNGYWDDVRQVQVSFAVGGKQYFYGQDLSSRDWFIQHLK